MPPEQIATFEVQVDFRRFEHTKAQYGGTDKIAAVDAV